MAKITFMGAGSTVFARNVLGDCMCSPALCDSEIALYDIDSQRLEDSQVILNGINQNVNQGRAKIKTYLGEENRKEALKGSGFCCKTLFRWADMIPVPLQILKFRKKYGLRPDYCRQPGDRRYHAGASDYSGAGRLCQGYRRGMPGRLFLNYTNPMGILSGYMERYTGVKTVGLCHSVQVCSKTLLEELGMEDKLEGRTELIAGINHMAWLLKIKDKDGNACTRKSGNGRPRKTQKKSTMIWSVLNISADWATIAPSPANITQSIILSLLKINIRN